ncbi:hypothetical protein BBJ28_00011826 [Nothophytophthora sp. Chile5]|nr:hypothetical protein BBJ28_00011826 [Nothophytophthora sp. Chile5]
MLGRIAKPLAAGALSLGAVGLYVDAPMADLGDGSYGGQRREVFPEWVHDMARVPIFAGATFVSKFYLQLLNRTSVQGSEILAKQLDERPAGTSVITISNHSATVDDPAVFANMMSWNQEYCYSKGRFLSAVFFGAKTLPVKRGAGIDHKEIGRLKWGVGKLIARATQRPIVVPIYHHNMEQLMPQDEHNRLISVFPKTNLDLSVIVGEPLSFEDLFEKYAADRVVGSSPWASQDREKALYSAITRRIEDALLDLEKQTRASRQ